jgi:hypothetical protein
MLNSRFNIQIVVSITVTDYQFAFGETLNHFPGDSRLVNNQHMSICGGRDNIFRQCLA